MKRKNATRSALFTSIISLLLCVSMLVGATFAWFTDNVQSGINTIAAGNLDVELYHSDKNDSGYVDVNTVLFNDVALWEPGVVAYENFVVENKGNLALKYQLSINFENETVVNGHGLSEALQVAVVDGGFNGGREDAQTLTNLVPLKSFVESGVLEGDTKSETYGIVIYWQPGDDAVDNLFNMKNVEKNADGSAVEPLTIDLGVNLFATQEMYEEDSFGEDYDKGAVWTGNANIDWYDPDAAEFTLSSGEELAGLAAIVNGTATSPVTTFAADGAAAIVHDDFKGKTVKLGANINLNDVAWTPIGRIGSSSTDFTYSFKGTFDGQGHTVANLNVSNAGWAGLFGIAYGATINNVTVDDASISSSRMAGAIVGQIYGSIDNCHVKNTTIMVVPNAVEGGYDNGDKVGGIVGWLGDNGNNRVLSNCSAENVKIGAYRDVGGIAGYVASSTTVQNNSVKAVELTVDQITNYYGDKDFNAGKIYGRTGGAITEANNSADEESVIEITYAKNGMTLKQDGESDAVTLYLVPASYEQTTVNVPEGVTEIGGYAFAYNDNIETIVLPTTVTTLNDRAFRDTGASTVVLNEGLTNISYQAFRNALNVNSVEIPSTVTTISKEAFQNSGIKTLTIPATVTTLEYGACRDMKNVETVIIEGNADIPVYAFRACTNLKTVILTGEDVTFGGGSRGMIFCNTENGNGSAITVYVANEAVKERLLAADTAAKDYGGYKIVVDGVADSAEELNEALEGGNDVVLTDDVSAPATNSNAYGKTALNVTAGQTIDGNGKTLSATGANGTWDSAISITSGTIKNLTVDSGFRGIFINHNGTAGKVILENVVVDGSVYTISCDQGTGSGLEAINSVFNGWTSYAATIGNVKFVDCSFGEGQGYNFSRPYAPTEYVGCDFEEGHEMDPRAAVTFENCTIGGEPLTAENLSVLVISNIANATVK